MPPLITGDEFAGFSRCVIKAVLSRRGERNHRPREDFALPLKRCPPALGRLAVPFGFNRLH